MMIIGSGSRAAVENQYITIQSNPFLPCMKCQQLSEGFFSLQAYVFMSLKESLLLPGLHYLDSNEDDWEGTAIAAENGTWNG